MAAGGPPEGRFLEAFFVENTPCWAEAVDVAAKDEGDQAGSNIESVSAPPSVVRGELPTRLGGRATVPDGARGERLEDMGAEVAHFGEFGSIEGGRVESLCEAQMTKKFLSFDKQKL